LAFAHPASANGNLYVLSGHGGEVLALRHPDVTAGGKRSG
jgi:hypothetical protein